MRVMGSGGKGLVQEGVEEAVAGLVANGEARFQAVAQGHQFFDLGDDTVLFGEGWKGYGEIFQLISGNARKCDPPSHADYLLAHVPKEKPDKAIIEQRLDGRNSSSNTSVKGSNVRASSGRTTNANEKISFVAKISRCCRVLVYNRSTERSFTKFNRSVDQWHALAASVVCLSRRTLPHNNIRDFDKLDGSPSRWEVRRSVRSVD